jgi:hypothetical protein
MRFVEADHAFEVVACPVDDLLEAAVVTACRTKRRVGDEEHALLQRYRLVDLPVGEGLDVGRETTERGPVTPRVFEQRLVLRNPDVPAAAGEPAVEDARGDLPPLPRPGPVAEEIAHAIGAAILRFLKADAFLGGPELPR